MLGQTDILFARFLAYRSCYGQPFTAVEALLQVGLGEGRRSALNDVRRRVRPRHRLDVSVGEVEADVKVLRSRPRCCQILCDINQLDAVQFVFYLNASLVVRFFDSVLRQPAPRGE